MIELFNLYKLVNDYILVQDIDLVRTLANEVLADIENIYGGIRSFTRIGLQSSEDSFRLSTLTSKLISVFMNGFKLKQVDLADLQSLKEFVEDWQDKPRYFVYAFTPPYTINFISGIAEEDLNKYDFAIEVILRIPRFLTNNVNLPDYYIDVMIKGILAKLLLHPKYFNPDLAVQYQSVYQNAIQNNFNFNS